LALYNFLTDFLFAVIANPLPEPVEGRGVAIQKSHSLDCFVTMFLAVTATKTKEDEI